MSTEIASRPLGPLLMLLALGAGCTCAGPSPGGSGPSNQSTIRVPVETPIASLDPATAGDAVSRRATSAIFDTLVDWTPGEPPALVPELLAELPVLDEASNTVRLVLPPRGQRRQFAADECLPGGEAREVTAEDIRTSLLRHREPTSSGHGLLAPRLRGFTSGAGIEVLDENQVRVRLSGPQPDFTAILASPQLAIVPPECLAYYDGEGRPAFADHPVGSGPFTLDHAQSEPGRAAVLRRREPADPSTLPRPYDVVILERIADRQTELELFRRGELGTMAPGQAQFDAVLDDQGRPLPGALPDGTTVHAFPMLRTNLLVFVMTDPLVGTAAGDRGLALRRAVSRAFDVPRYQKLVQNELRARPARGLVPYGLADDELGVEPLFRDAPHRPDPEGAARLLREAEIESPRLTYLTGTSEAEHQEADLFVAAMKAAGLEVRVEHDLNVLGRILDPERRAGIQVFALAFDADYPAPANFYEQLRCTGAIAQIAGFCDLGFDRRMDTGAPWAELERHLGDQAVVRPIDHPRAWLLAAPGVTGLVRDPIVGLRVEQLAAQSTP